jgi:hypothetical protein
VKRGIKIETLTIDPAKPPVFDINIQPGPVVQIYGTAEPVSEVVVGNKKRFRLLPVICFDVDHDEPAIDRRFVLLPVGADGGWIEDAAATYCGIFINPLNKLPLALYEVPWTEVTPSVTDSSVVDEVTPDAALDILQRAQENTP